MLVVIITLWIWKLSHGGNAGQVLNQFSGELENQTNTGSVLVEKELVCKITLWIRD